MITDYKILPGLPAHGPMAESFPTSQLLAREGLVISISANDGNRLINFKKGGTNFDKVFKHPDGRRLIVCASGIIYFVGPAIKDISLESDLWVSFAFEAAKQNMIVFFDLFKIYAEGKTGIIWQTQKNWDGFREIQILENTIRGQAFSRHEGNWKNFEIDIQTGTCEGG